MKEQFLNLSGLTDLVTYMKLCIAQHKVIIPKASFSLFPETGDENNIYIDTSTNAIYRWNDTDKKFVLLAKPPRTIVISEGTNNGEITLKVDNIASNAKVHGLTSTAFTESNKFATAAQGAKADSAVQTITLSSGTKNGTIKIKVNNITTDNIEVAGLGSAAFSDIGIFAAKSHTHKKDEVGLGNVDNTADINKSVKYATSAGAVSWKNITDKPTLFPPQQHNHDSLYYRKNEVDSLLSSKSDTGHTHVQFIQETKFSNGTYSDPLNGTDVAIKASGGIASDLIYEGGKTLADKYQAKGSYAASSHKQAYTSDECTSYESDSNTMGVTPAAVKKAFGIFGPKAHTHKKTDITDFPTSLPASDVYGWAKASSKPSYTKSEVGLGNVDNTADANKSVKYAGSSGSSNTIVYTALTNTNLNTLQTEGRWYYAGGGNTCTNIPVESAAFELYVGRNASGWRYQQFTVTSGEIYIRVFDSSNWGNWRKLAFTSDTVTAASSVPWSGITGKPSTFAPSSHNHTIANITDIGKASVNFANSAGCPQGFALRQATATWGNQTGTVVTDWHTSNGGDIAFRDNKGQLNVVIDGFFYQNEGKNLVLDSGNYSNYAAAKSHTHTISNITNLQTTLDGKSNTNHTHDLNPMINTLANGTSDPVDADYYIAQYAGGGSTTTTYYRRPHSALWNYIKGKANSVYQPKGSYAASSHTHDDRYYTESEINTKLASKSDTSHTHNYVVGSYTGNGGQQKPNYFGTNKVGFLMMNTTVNGDSNYKDWIIMDCYGGNDVGGSVALGVNRQKLAAYIMRSAAERSSWAESAELLHTLNYTSYTVTKTGSGASGTWGISISGNATTSTKLATARSINGTNFDGSGNITTATWGTARTLTIGNTGKSVNGGGNVSWSLSEIGAAASNHTHSYLPLSGGAMTGNISYRGSKATYKMIEFIDNSSDEYGNGIAIGGGGLTIIGGGESADVVKSTSTRGGDERLILANDGAIDIYTNCQNGIDKATHITIDNTGLYSGTAAKANSVPWSGVTGKPSTYTPSSHNHTVIQGTSSTSAVPGKANDGFCEFYYNVNNGLANNMPSSNNANAIISISRHAGDYTSQLGFSSNGNLYYREGVGATAWKTILTSSNYTSYTVTKTGGGASGTWGINITGSAGSVAWGNVSGKPSSYTPSSHTHDDRYYTETEINTKLGAKLGAVSANGYYGMTRPDGNTSDWIRTTTAGIIPYQSGGAGAGHCGIGTSSWYFSNAYIDTVNCVNTNASGYLQANGLINTYSEYQSQKGSRDWRFGSATGSGDQNWFGFYDYTYGYHGGIYGPGHSLRMGGEIQSTAANGFRAVQGKYGFIIRNDGANVYFMMTGNGDPWGGWNDNYTIFTPNGEWQVKKSPYDNGMSTARGYVVVSDSNDNRVYSISNYNANYLKVRCGLNTYHCTYSNSDIRLKKNINNTSITNALSVINSIKVRQFDWKETNIHQSIGFVADELEKLDPNFSQGGGVTKDGGIDVKSVNSFYLQGYIVKALQELSSQVSDLKQENKRLKQKLNMCN